MENKDFQVKLGDYKDITIPQFEVSATEEEIDQVLAMELQRHGVLKTVDAPAQNGDTVVIDFAGFLGEEQFEGGTSQNYSLKLGSGSFIPGFEEQLIGSKAGDDVDVNVTFPAQYHAPDLAGKAVVFKCKVHAVQQECEPELNDAFAQEVYHLDNVAALREAVRSSICKRKVDQNVAQVREMVVSQLLERSEVTVSDEFLDIHAGELLEMFSYQLSQQGATLEMYCAQTGATVEKLKEMLRPQATERAKGAAVLSAVADAEGIVITEEDMEQELDAMAKAYDMTLDELKANVDEAARKRIAMNMRVTRAMTLVITNGKKG